MFTILPTLRGIMASGGRLPRLRVTPAPAGEAGLPIATEAAPAELVATLRAGVPAGARQVCIQGVGTVTAEFGDGKGRAAGRIALVTGAAQGFGCEIASDLAAQGAWVALADVNVAGASAAAQRINAACGREAAMGVAVNVTDPVSIQAAVQSVVAQFGGLFEFELFG